MKIHTIEVAEGGRINDGGVAYVGGRAVIVERKARNVGAVGVELTEGGSIAALKGGLRICRCCQEGTKAHENSLNAHSKESL